MLLPNCLFRVGGAAMLLTNKKREGFRAKYQLLHSVRTHLGARDDAYNCIFQVWTLCEQVSTGVSWCSWAVWRNLHYVHVDTGLRR